MPRNRNVTVVLTILAVACCSLFAAACGASSASQPDPEYVATVPALLPTLQPTDAPVMRSETSTPPTAAAMAPTDTPVPPTYTPRPAPTYTPRPAPPASTAGDRPTGTLFQATTLDGIEVNLTETYGTPTLLAFWAPW